jgi:hypothetical protein
MASLSRIALAAGLLTGAAVASAHATTVDFAFSEGGTDVATGSFSYSTSNPVVGYADLSAFSLTVGGFTYDLAFALGNTNYQRLAYDQATKSFVEGTGNGSFGPLDELFGAANDTFSKGFFFALNPGSTSAGNFTEDQSSTFRAPFDGVTVTVEAAAVPEPATLALVVGPLALLGWRRRAS